MPGLRLGKSPATDDPHDLLFANYVEAAQLPQTPPEFGHESLFPPKGWGMLGNDEWGDCAWAGPAHETMLLSKEGGHPAAFTTQGVLSDYSAGTGFDPHAGPPGENPTDRGSNVRDVLRYRRHTGIVDAANTRHKIGAFVKLNPGNLTHIYQAMYLFEVVGIGFRFPEFAMQQFHEGKPWDVVPGAPEPREGHYVCCVGKRQNIDVVTWGVLQQMTQAFFETYCDEAWAYLSLEDLNAETTPNGFKLGELKKDLAALRKG
ncbi:MAG TPA: hypothetical protein VFV03_07910 [Solirubrobacteraceae bacterium]|nr:hypothetical protein [Solirubrobacteraceae bacterium]